MNTENDLIKIEVEPKIQKRARKSKKEPINAASSLLTALKFIKSAQNKNGTTLQQYCLITNHWAVASNGILTIAHPIEEDLEACPHTFKFIDALQKCGQELNITQLSENTLSVKSDKFKALIECVNKEFLNISFPDPKSNEADDRIKTALGLLHPFATDGATQAPLAAVLLQNCSAVATNGVSLIEYWHGHFIPMACLIPKLSAASVAKSPYALIGLGFSKESITFYFENGALIKTQVFVNENYPNYESFFKKDLNLWPLQDDFFKAVGAIETFSKNGIIHFDENSVSSHELESQASTYKIEGLPVGMAFNTKYLQLIKNFVQRVEFDNVNNKMYFFTDISRGVLNGADLDDIPF